MEDLLSKKRFHLIGIGGIGMSGLAHLLLRQGYTVSGSDAKESEVTRRLREEGAEIHIGHQKDHVKGAEVVVYSSAVRRENPERSEAMERNLSILSRGELLALLFRKKEIRIAITGSHGKTTTTALAAWLFHRAGYDPSYLIGGISHNLGGNAEEGRGNSFVTEADESDGSFLFLSPTHAIVTNMDAEHLDYYGTHEKSLEAYAAFLEKTEKGGTLLVSADCPHTPKALKRLGERPVLSFGFSRPADYLPDAIVRSGEGSQFDCLRQGKKLAAFQLNLPGLHNISNALSVIALGCELGIPIPVIQETLKSFQGVERRLEVKHNFPALTIIEDYAHHPAEIEATLEALRGSVDGRRIVGGFQPHRYTRTKLLSHRFGNCFQKIDFLIITDIYAASEAPIPGISAETLLEEVRRVGCNKELLFLPKKDIATRLLDILRPKDILLVMGAGDVTEVTEEMSVLCRQGDLPWIYNRSSETV